MTTDHIRYDILAQEALRGVVRKVMADAAKHGMVGDHHFKIAFDPSVPGVRLSARLRQQYPDEMTIILQHQFWDLTVNDDAFEVGLSFGGVPERLRVPFEAINGFFDPSVNFGLQFATIIEETEAAETASSTQDDIPAGKRATRTPAAQPAAPAPEEAKTNADSDKPSGGGEVVRLDRFRKK
jgi:uncharacterized protein